MFLIYIANIYLLQSWFVFFTEFLPDKIYFLLAEHSLSQVHIWGYKILLSQTVPKLFCFISRISSSPMGWDQMKKNLSEIFWSFPQSGRESFAERPLLIRIEFDSTRFVWIRSKEHFDKWYFCFWKADKSNWSGQMVRWSFGQRDRKRRTRCYQEFYWLQFLGEHKKRHIHQNYRNKNIFVIWILCHCCVW